MNTVITFIETVMTATFKDRFYDRTAVINSGFPTTDIVTDGRLKEAYDDLSEALILDYPAIALLVWSLYHMDGILVETDDIATETGFSSVSLSSAFDELKRRGYMVPVNSEIGVLDVTLETKELVINHYCFGKLLQ